MTSIQAIAVQLGIDADNACIYILYIREDIHASIMFRKIIEENHTYAYFTWLTLHTHTRKHACTHTRMHARTHTHTHTHIHTHAHTHTHTYTHAHTHTHTHTLSIQYHISICMYIYSKTHLYMSNMLSIFLINLTRIQLTFDLDHDVGTTWTVAETSNFERSVSQKIIEHFNIIISR